MKKVDYKPIVTIAKIGKEMYAPKITIGYRSFCLPAIDKKGAQWYARMLRIAFKNLTYIPPGKQA